MDFDKSIIDDFVIESKEHLESVEGDLLNLEKQAESADPELINRVFRAVHTVKGTAGFVGLVNLANLAHVLETILSMIRAGEMKPESSIVDELLHGVDLIRAMLDDVYASNDMDIANIMIKLTAIVDNGAAVCEGLAVTCDDVLEDEKPEPENSAVPLADILEKEHGFTVDKNLLRSAQESSEYFYILDYDFSEFSEKHGLTPLALIKHLDGHGNVVEINADVPVQDLHVNDIGGPFPCKILYATKVAPDSIEHVVMLQGDCVTSLKNDSFVSANEVVNTDADNNEQTYGTAHGEPDMPQEVVADSAVDEASQKDEPAKAVVSEEGDNKNRNERAETIRINVGVVDKLMTLAGELVLVRNQYVRSVDRSNPTGRAISQRLDVITSELQDSIMATRMQPIGNIFGKFPRVVRELGKNLDKKIEIDIIGSEVELDKTILEALADPLTHLIRNCCDHGVELPADRLKTGKAEVGQITLRAYHEGGQINIEIKDDGKGIDVKAVLAKALEKKLKTEDELSLMSEKEVLSLIFQPGFSTAAQVTDVSGRGVGMDVVKTSIDSLGGVLDVESVPGEGTIIFLRLPLTLAIIPCLIIQSGEYRFAIPQINVEELVCLYDNDVREKIECAGDREVYRLRNRLLSMIRLNEVFNRPETFTDVTRAEITEKYRSATSLVQPAEVTTGNETHDDSTNATCSLNFAVLKFGINRLGLIVDKVLGTEEIVVKPVHPAVKNLGLYSGATVMGDGKVALILDVQGIARHTGVDIDRRSTDEQLQANQDQEVDTQNVLLFSNGEKEQFAISLPLIKRIERISPSKIENVGDSEFITVDGVSTRVIRIDSCLSVSKCDDKEEMFLLLPKHINKPVGILMSDLTDIETVPIELNVDSYKEEGVLGTAIVRGKMTLFLDICRLVEKSERPFGSHDSSVSINRYIGRTGRILLVEDTPFFRSLIKGYLESAGHDVVVAENGQKAIDIFRDSEFDLVVADLEMPVMDGFDLMKEIRTAESDDVPAIALTASDSDQSRTRAMECGFNEFEVKVDREHLLTTITGLLPKGNGVAA